METDKIIGSSLESLTADHSAIEAERQQAHAQVEDVQRREQEYRSRVREFEQEINRHPGLSPLEKSAWRSAIRKSPPEQIETTAYAITEMLGRLNDLFSQADLPVFDFGIGDNNVEVTAFTTTGSGLVVSDNDWYVETEGKNFQGTDSEQSKSIKVDELRRVLVSAEDVEDAWSEFTQTAADGQRSRMQTAYLAIGQDAIVAISEKLFESDFSSPYENLSDLISRRAKDIGIDINEVSLPIGKKLAEKRLDRARFAAKTILAISLQGHEGLSYERVASYADSQDVPVEEVIDEIEARYKTIRNDTNSWLDDLHSSLTASRLQPDLQEFNSN